MWYVAAWSYEIGADEPIARQIIGEPLALFRGSDGKVRAFEDRCPHRMAPLSMGRIEGDKLRCMYHGLRFNCEGACVSVPATDRIPNRLNVRTFPVVEQSGWVWVWMGDPEKADASLIPKAWGLEDPDWHLKSSALDYDADYQLIHDNLLDLSHLDFVHETTLGVATGGKWSEEIPQVSEVPNGLFVWRWLRNAKPPYRDEPVDTHTSYYFVLPGLFLQTVKVFPSGTAESHPDGENLPDPTFLRVDQQAVTPVAPGKSRYFYAAGVSAKFGNDELAEKMLIGAQAAFKEDKTMVEAQARSIANTDPARRMSWIPMDKAPAMFRKLITERLAAESAQ